MTPRDADDEFSVGAWRAYPKENRLVCGDRVESIEPRVMSVLVCLSATPGKIVSADRLLDEVWMGRAHGDHTVYQAIADLRKALGDDAGNPRFIETIPKRGYRLICPVSANVTKTKVDAQTASLDRNIKGTGLTAGIVSIAVVLLLAAIWHLREGPSATVNFIDDKTVAVVPFVNMSDDPGNDYFASGLSEEIRTLLTKIPGLRVIGRSSSEALANKNADLREMSRSLGVRTILEGSVRQADNRVRIAVQLVDIEDGTHIWSESYDRVNTDLFAVQDDVAAAIIDALRIHVGTNPTRGRPTENWKAYTLFLEAKVSMHVDKRHAEEMLLRATELDPSFAEAWELLSFVYFRLAGDIIEAAQGQKLTGDAAARALAINPDLVLARAMFEAGNVETWSLAREIAALERALQEQPNNLGLLHALRYDLFQAGYHREALELAERMIELDPLAHAALDSLTTSLYALERTDEAIALLESANRMGNSQAIWDLGEIYLVAGKDDLAFEYFEAHERHTGYADPTWVQDWVDRGREPETGLAYMDSGIEEEVAAMADEDAYRWRLGSAVWYLHLGYLDRYFELVFATNPVASNWTDAEGLISSGMKYRRQGFTAHAKFPEVAQATGIMDVWEQRGPPDFCDKLEGNWVCQ